MHKATTGWSYEDGTNLMVRRSWGLDCAVQIKLIWGAGFEGGTESKRWGAGKGDRGQVPVERTPTERPPSKCDPFRG